MFKKPCAVLLITISMLLSGCGTLALGSSQLVRINSQPQGAQIAINGQVLGLTPATVRLSTTSMHIMQVALPGYEPQVIQLNKVFNNWTWLNLLLLPAGILTGLIGFAIDANTGGMYRLEPSQVNVAFDQMGATPPADARPGDVAIFVVLEPDPSWAKIGQLQPLAARSTP